MGPLGRELGLVKIFWRVASWSWQSSTHYCDDDGDDDVDDDGDDGDDDGDDDVNDEDEMMVMMMMARRKMTLAANTIWCDGDPGHVFNEAPATTWAAVPPTLSCGVGMQ